MGMAAERGNSIRLLDGTWEQSSWDGSGEDSRSCPALRSYSMAGAASPSRRYNSGFLARLVCEAKFWLADPRVAATGSSGVGAERDQLSGASNGKSSEG